MFRFMKFGGVKIDNLLVPFGFKSLFSTAMSPMDSSFPKLETGYVSLRIETFGWLKDLLGKYLQPQVPKI